MTLHKGSKLSALACLLFVLSCILTQVSGQDCSAANPCATGCCSKHGYCGTGETYCGADCVANCDYESTAQCSATKPCAEGCCSKFGICGYGPDYCSQENCVSSCGQPSECDPGDWGSEFANSTTCPLNVCCSKYGFCGTTEEFCGEKKVKRPSCGTGGKLQRIVGYYEGWAAKRPCKAFWPEQIPRGVYTHLNYAFATVDPLTFEVLPPTSLEARLMKRLTALKRDDSGLRVNIAIGGWSFNDPGSTASIFTELAASEAKQRKFFRSLTSFLATYDFDGVDIDWEYPVDGDRGGQEVDFANFPRFMTNLKHALRGTGGRGELSLTLPTSYWYLRNFDIKSLAKSVDYFNYMSYDLHGTWDRGNKWTGDYLDAHTNLTEIADSLDLLWRNNISPDKVVMGIAFYSRAFTVADTNCMAPGCRFGSGSDPGPCSGQTGILMNSELDDIRANRSLTPSWDKKAAVQIMKWDNQWATYDDATTFKQRIAFAKKTCLGGVMVWAVSHDTYDGVYSSALASLSPQAKHFKKLTISTDGLTVTEDEQNKQCKWTACGQTCPVDFVAISRSDSKYRKGELMLDGIDCPKGSSHTLCCPKEDVPKCGWYTHNNGKCNPECPSGYFEIGSISSNGLCKASYQAACCQTNKDSTKLYSTLQWSTSPDCDSGECPVLDDSKSDTLTLATTGSGDAWCNTRSYKTRLDFTIADIVYQERKLCYDSGKDKMAWDGCDWYRSVDSPPKGKSGDYCVDSCPSDMVRLATYKYDETCAGGTRAFCCSDKYYVSKSHTNPEMLNFRAALNDYQIEGTCYTGEESSLSRRDDPSSSLVRRGAKKLEEFNLVYPLLYSLLKTKDSDLDAKQQVEAGYWDDWARANSYLGLVLSTLRSYAQQTRLWSELGGDEMAQRKSIPVCQGDPCDEDADPDLCRTAELDGEIGDDSNDEDDDDDGLVEKRGFSPLRPRDSLQKRGVSQKTFEVHCADGTKVEGLKITPEDYYSAGKWKPADIQYQEARTYQSRQDCANPLVDPLQKQGNNYDTEHILELQIIGTFFEYATQGKLVSGRSPAFQRIGCHFFLKPSQHPNGLDFLHQPDLDGVLLYPGDPNKAQRKSKRLWQYPEFRIMSALGSKRNKKNFYLLEKAVNGMKARVFGNKDLVDPRKWTPFVEDTSNPGIPLKELKAAIAVWHYLNDQEVKASFVEIVSDLRMVWEAVDNEFNHAIPLFLPAWDEWWHDWIDYQVERTSKWVAKGISEMRDVWENVSDEDPAKLVVLAALSELSGFHSAIVTYSHTIFP
ncbi:class V chitinase [Aspergillus homomorphus CBS 101889]|uniref:chitinase n=1 Tax=Aspergillus homomorphus (strain CBS 101889) TaxID=1450537 RepID=A0A395HG26_ASPHC|nr:class V chitinase [Aspergillus homomorphus CBS 101889]RAL06586.1 class V chitinase [Aspergillus homomorphus CBS 101889]